MAEAEAELGEETDEGFAWRAEARAGLAICGDDRDMVGNEAGGDDDWARLAGWSRDDDDWVGDE